MDQGDIHGGHMFYIGLNVEHIKIFLSEATKHRAHIRHVTSPSKLLLRFFLQIIALGSKVGHLRPHILYILVTKRKH